MFLVTVFNSLVAKYRGGKLDSLVVKSKANGNPYQTKNAFGPGIEINPAEGERLVVTKIGGSDSYLVNIAGLSDKVSPDTNPGERRFFSVDNSGDLSAFMKLKNNGIMELNGNNDFAVKYLELETAFNQLKTDFNNSVTKINDFVTAYNAHTHGGAVPVPATPVTPATQSTADISPAKSSIVKLS